jgi:hypothetical protein
MEARPRLLDEVRDHQRTAAPLRYFVGMPG